MTVLSHAKTRTRARTHDACVSAKRGACAVGAVQYLAGDEALNTIFDDLGVGLEKFHELS